MTDSEWFTLKCVKLAENVVKTTKKHQEELLQKLQGLSVVPGIQIGFSRGPC